MYWVWKIVRWAGIAALVMFVVKHPDRAAHLVIQFVDGASKVVMAFFNFLGTLVTHITGA